MRANRFYLAAAALLIASIGCTGWRPHTAQGAPVPTGLHGDLRVTRNDNSVFLLTSATVGADSIIGLLEGTATRTAIARTDVRSVDRREVSPVRTAGLAIGSKVLIAWIALSVAIASLASW